MSLPINGRGDPQYLASWQSNKEEDKHRAEVERDAGKKLYTRDLFLFKENIFCHKERVLVVKRS